MTPTTRNKCIRKKRGTAWNTESSRRANKVRWERDRQRREDGMPSRIAEMREIEIQNLPRNQGDLLGTLQWTEQSTGKVRRWHIHMGDRIDRITFTNAKGQSSKSCGWTHFLSKLRHHLSSHS